MELLSDQQMAFKAVWAILNTNSKIYFRKKKRLLAIKNEFKIISLNWKNICPTKRYNLSAKYGTKHMFLYHNFHCYFEANGPNHVHFLLEVLLPSAKRLSWPNKWLLKEVGQVCGSFVHIMPCSWQSSSTLRTRQVYLNLYSARA